MSFKVSVTGLLFCSSEPNQVHPVCAVPPPAASSAFPTISSLKIMWNAQGKPQPFSGSLLIIPHEHVGRSRGGSRVGSAPLPLHSTGEIPCAGMLTLAKALGAEPFSRRSNNINTKKAHWMSQCSPCSAVLPFWEGKPAPETEP